MALESARIRIPSEAIMLFAGFAVSKGGLTLAGIVVAEVLGNLVGSLVGYAIEYFGRLDPLEGLGKSWESWRHYLVYLDYATVATVVVGIAWLLRRRRDEDAAPAA
jgi:membrane protein DedA with SNARE-associated domain